MKNPLISVLRNMTVLYKLLKESIITGTTVCWMSARHTLHPLGPELLSPSSILNQGTYYEASCFDYYEDDILIRLWFILPHSIHLRMPEEWVQDSTHTVYRQSEWGSCRGDKSTLLHESMDRIHYNSPVNSLVHSWWSHPAIHVPKNNNKYNKFTVLIVQPCISVNEAELRLSGDQLTKGRVAIRAG